VLIPLSAVFLKSVTSTWSHLWRVVTSPEVVASYRLSFGASLVAGMISVVVGFLVAWVLVRYQFPGKALADALVDLPFALPPRWPASRSPASTPKTVAGPLPGAARHQSRIHSVGRGGCAHLHRAAVRGARRAAGVGGRRCGTRRGAASLGANRWQVFRLVIFPSCGPPCSPVRAGLRRALASTLVIFIAGNMPMKTEITPLLIVTKLEQYD